MTFYLLIFLIILVLAEIRNKTIRKYFNFLDGKIGRGCFIFFIGLLVFVENRPMEIIFGIIIAIIAVINCIFGWGQKSDGKDAQAERELTAADIRVPHKSSDKDS